LFSLFIGYPIEEWRRAFFYLHSVGVLYPTEIGELRLRTPRPVAIYLCESVVTANNYAKAKLIYATRGGLSDVF